MMAPVAQEHAGFTTLLSGSGDEPVYESLAVLIVQGTVGFQAKVDVSEYRCLVEQIQNFSPLLLQWLSISSTRKELRIFPG